MNPIPSRAWRSLLLASLLLIPGRSYPGEPAQAPAFLWGQDGYHTYRIPARTAPEGGTLLAFCEGRKQGYGDRGAINLLWERSPDGGETLQKEQIIRDDSGGACGSPCPDLGRVAGTLGLLAAHNLGSDTEALVSDGKRQGTRTVAVAEGTDGVTWSKPVGAEAKAAPAPGKPHAEPGRGELFFSVKTWEGEYSSKDVPGGVETTPVVGAIYTVKGDGTGLRKVVGLGKNTDYPTVSPDGQWVYFQSNATGRSQVYRCRPDGGGVANLTAGGRLGKPWKDAFGYSLSSDGTKLLYTVHDGLTGRVALADADGSGPRLIAPGLGYTYMAALSPANDRVVFSGPARGYRLLLVTLPDGKPVELTPEHAECFVPQFTPDGRTVVFIRRDGDVYRVGADGKNLRRLTAGGRHVEFKLSARDRHGSTDGPHVSPDGKRIAYVAVKGGVPNVCVMNLDGTGQRQLTSRKAACGRVRWSPDGSDVAFVSFAGKYPQLFVVAAKGGEPRQLTRLAGAVYFVAWKPHSKTP